MKCDNCKHFKISDSDPGNDFGTPYCAAGHWHGFDLESDTENDYYEDCEDYATEKTDEPCITS